MHQATTYSEEGMMLTMNAPGTAAITVSLDPVCARLTYELFLRRIEIPEASAGDIPLITLLLGC